MSLCEFYVPEHIPKTGQPAIIAKSRHIPACCDISIILNSYIIYLLDIGCGNGAMVVKATKKFPEAQVTGVDYWGFGWDYS